MNVRSASCRNELVTMLSKMSVFTPDNEGHKQVHSARMNPFRRRGGLICRQSSGLFLT